MERLQLLGVQSRLGVTLLASEDSAQEVMLIVAGKTAGCSRLTHVIQINGREVRIAHRAPDGCSIVASSREATERRRSVACSAMGYAIGPSFTIVKLENHSHQNWL